MEFEQVILPFSEFVEAVKSGAIDRKGNAMDGVDSAEDDEFLLDSGDDDMDFGDAMDFGGDESESDEEISDEELGFGGDEEEDGGDFGEDMSDDELGDGSEDGDEEEEDEEEDIITDLDS